MMHLKFPSLPKVLRPDHGDIVFPGKSSAGAAFILGAACIAVGLTGLIGSIAALPFNPGAGIVGGFISIGLLTTGIRIVNTAQHRLKALEAEAKNPPSAQPMPPS